MTEKQDFIHLVHEAFRQGQKLTVRELRKFAQQTNLPPDDKNLWELCEVAWVMWYRKIVQDNRQIYQGHLPAFNKIVKFYQTIQPTFTSRDSVRQIFQQYSTSAPIAFLAGWFTLGAKREADHLVFEPSAGNGLLTIFYDASQVDANEIDPTRLENLRLQDFHGLSELDASKPFPEFRKHMYDAVLTNPPFGTLGEVNRDYGWGFRKLDHVMVAHALDTMRDDGRAAIIIGGHTEYDEKSGVVRSGRPFFDWLFRHYRVIDMINIDSPRLYAKQGTTFPLRMILVAGRKQQPFGFGPSRRDFPEYAMQVSDFQSLRTRVLQARVLAAEKEVTLNDLLITETEKIRLEITE